MLNPIVRTVKMMMARHGGPAVLVVDSGESTYDVATSRTVPNIKKYELRVIGFDYIQKTSGLSSADGTLIQTGDKQIFIEPKAGVPAPTGNADKIEFEGKLWTVIAVKSHNPSGASPILYEVYARV